MTKTLVMLLFVTVGFVVLDLGLENKPNPTPAPAVFEEVQQPAQEESLARIKHVAGLKKIWDAVRNDWEGDTSVSGLPYLCRQSVKFTQTRYLYQAVTLKSALDSDGMELAVRPDDPRLQVDMRVLEKARESIARLYISDLHQRFEAYVDEKTPVIGCSPMNGQPTTPMNLADILYRMTEVSEDSGLQGKYPTPAEIRHMADFAINEQKKLNERGKETPKQIRLFFASLQRKPVP
jgi:hypothetical protein